MYICAYVAYVPASSYQIISSPLFFSLEKMLNILHVTVPGYNFHYSAWSLNSDELKKISTQKRGQPIVLKWNT